jgi:hypothetical protein
MLPVRFYPSFLYLVLSFLFLQIYIADLTQFFFQTDSTWTCARCGDMIEVNLHYYWSASSFFFYFLKVYPASLISGINDKILLADTGV